MCYLCDDPVPEVIPGDPDTVGRFAVAFKNTAEALREAARELGNLANENITISLAVDEVRDRAEGVQADTGRVAERYQGAGNTFAAYASALATARGNGNSARAQIISNNDHGRYWRHRERDLRQQVQWGNTDPEVLADLSEATRRASYYDSFYAGYIGRYDAAIDDRDAAVNAAINGLAEAEAAAGLNDGFWDGMLGDLQLLWELASKYLGPVLETLRGVLEILKQIVDVLALIVMIASFIFPALGPLALGLAAISALLAVAIFACSLLLFAMGRETLGRVLSDGISAVVSVVTATFGGGTLLGNIRGMFSGFAMYGMATRTVLVAAGTEGVATLAEYAAGQATDGLVGGLLSANAAPVEFAVGLADFQLGDSQPWGEPPAQGDLADMFVGLSDLPTLGAAGVAAEGIGIPDSWNSIGENAQETFDVWGSIGVVPAT